MAERGNKLTFIRALFRSRITLLLYKAPLTTFCYSNYLWLNISTLFALGTNKIAKVWLHKLTCFRTLPIISKLDLLIVQD